MLLLSCKSCLEFLIIIMIMIPRVCLYEQGTEYVYLRSTPFYQNGSALHQRYGRWWEEWIPFMLLLYCTFWSKLLIIIIIIRLGVSLDEKGKYVYLWSTFLNQGAPALLQRYGRWWEEWIPLMLLLSCTFWSTSLIIIIINNTLVCLDEQGTEYKYSWSNILYQVVSA